MPQMILCDKIVRVMKNRITQRNIIFEKVQNAELSARSHWKKIENIDFEFPKMSLDELRLLFFGTYRIKQARTYVEEHFDMDSDIIVEVDNSIDDIVRCSIQSRHSNAHNYWVDAKVSADFFKNVFKRCSATMVAWFSCI